MSLTLVVSPDGILSFIYEESEQALGLGVVGLLGEGFPDIHRVSYVEPYPGGGWSADMSPIGGPVLGPYLLRGDALRAEIEYLHLNLFGGRNEKRHSI